MKLKLILLFIAITLLMFSPVSKCAWLEPPMLNSPPNESRFGYNDVIPIFQWTDTEFSRFEIEFAVDEDFEISTQPLEIEDNFFDLSQILPEEYWPELTLSLYWRVRGVNFLGLPGPWSEVWIIYKTRLHKTQLLTPVDQARFGIGTQLPLFTWTVQFETNQFILEFSYNADFSDSLGQIPLIEPILDFNGVDIQLWNGVIGTFFWRVCEVENETPGPWSDTRLFHKTLLEPIHLLWPGDGTRFPPKSSIPFFEWEESPEEQPYEIRFSMDRDGREILGSLEYSNTQLDLAEFLTENEWWNSYANLFWSVATYDSEGRPGPWSETWEMTKVGYHRISVFGDSITFGECVDNGYLDMLRERLQSRWGTVGTANQAVPGTKTGWGAATIDSALMESCPQFILILFGANDSVDPYGCDPPYECNVDGYLEDMVRIAWSRGTVPIISTVLPVNPEEKFAGAQPRVDMYNTSIREMVDRIGAPFVDLNELFWEYGEDMPMLYCDWGHPSWDGYDVMAEGFYWGILANGG